MSHHALTRRMLPLVALALLGTACGAPAGGGSVATTPPASVLSSASSLADATDTTIAFPQQAPALGPQGYPAALFEGVLVLENDCLRVVPNYNAGTTYTPIWPPDVTLHTEVNPIEVRNPDGRVVARVGEQVQLGGGEGGMDAAAWQDLRSPVPANCPGPYWNTSPFPDQDTAAAPTPFPTQPVPSGLDPNDPLVQDAQYFAASEGISLEEAVRRLRLQDVTGVLSSELTVNERATFAGMWIQHQPEYRVVVAFTRDGEETIKPYVAGGELEDLIEVRTARYTQAELIAAQDELSRQLDEANIAVTSATNVQENRVEVYVYDVAQFNEALREANITLSPMVVPVAEGTNPVPNLDATATPLPPGVNVFFPQQAPTLGPRVMLEALIEGTLINENGCLRVQAPSGESELLIWPPELTLRATPDVIEVLAADGNVVARVGDHIRLGGGGISAAEGGFLPDDLARQPWAEACSGPYWFVGDYK